LQQAIISGSGCNILSARELKLEIERVNERFIQAYQAKQTRNHNFLGEKWEL
jgi:predicted RNA-binding protein with PIN domain